MADRNPWSYQDWDPVAQAEYIRTKGMARARIRAAEAGNTVHGTRPPGPKIKLKPGQLTPHQQAVHALVHRRNRNRPVAPPDTAYIVAGYTFGFQVETLIDREIDIILNPGIRSLTARMHVGVDEAHGGFGDVRELNVGNFALGFEQPNTPPTLMANLVSNHSLGVGQTSSFDYEIAIEANHNLGLSQEVAEIERAREILASMNIGVTETAVAGEVTPISAAISLGIDETAQAEFVYALAVSMGIGLEEAAIIYRERYLAAAVDLGITQLDSQPSLPMSASFDIGVAISALVEKYASLSPSFALGISDATAVDKFFSLSAAPELGISQSVVPTTFHSLPSDFDMGLNMVTGLYVPLELHPGTMGLGVSQAAAVQLEKDLVASPAIGIDMATALSAIAPPLVPAYISKDHQNNSATAVWTFTSKAIGTAAADRWVFVLFCAKNNNARTLTGITIGGVTATIETISGTLTSNQGMVGIAFANVPTGTTANIVATFSGGNFTATTSFGFGIDWYTVYGNLNTTAVDTHNVNTAANVSKTFSVPTGGVAFMVANPTGNGDGGLTRSVGSFFSTDDAYVQFVAGIWRYAGMYSNVTGGTVSASFASVNWVLGASAIPAVGRAYGHN